MENKGIKEYLLKRYPEQITIEKAEENFMEIVTDKEILPEVAVFCKEMGYDFLADITSADYKEYFMVVYQLFSFDKDERITLKVRLDDRQNPALDSLTRIWKTADWHEREVYDLMGIRFNNHPNLKRILMWEGFEGYPLRKDFPGVTRKRTWEVE